MIEYRTTNLREGFTQIVDHIEASGPKLFEYRIDLDIDSDNTPKTWTDR